MKSSIGILRSICLAILTIAAFFISTHTAYAYGTTADGFRYEIMDLEVTITGYFGDGSDITIPTTIDGYLVTRISFVGIKTNYSVTRLTIPDNIESIEGQAFSYWKNLSEVIIGGGLSGISSQSFNNCPNLSRVLFLGDAPMLMPMFIGDADLFQGSSPDLVVYYLSEKWGFSDPWYGNPTEPTDLIGITILSPPEKMTYEVGEDLDLSGIVVEGTFSQGSKVIIPISVENISGFNSESPDLGQTVTIMVNGYSDIFIVDIIENYTTQFEYVVSDNGAIITRYIGTASDVTIPSILDGYPVTGISRIAFMLLETPINNVVIPASVTDIEMRTFTECKGLMNIEVAADNTTYSSQDGVLYDKTGSTLLCYPSGKDIQTFIVPDHVSKIGMFSFMGNNILENVTIQEHVALIEMLAFANCTNLSSIEVLAGNMAYSSIDGVLYDKSKNLLFCYPAGKLDQTFIVPDDVTELVDVAFAFNDQLTSVVIAKNVKYIGMEAFYECSNLTSVTIDEGLTTIAPLAFEDCINLNVVKFYGNAPVVENYYSTTNPEQYPTGGVFVGCSPNLKIYYQYGKTGFADAWEGYPTIPFYVVEYHDNGSTSGTVPTDSITYLQGEVAIALSNSGDLAKTGYLFDSWNTQTDGLGTDKGIGDSIIMGDTGNVTLYAKWIPIQVTGIEITTAPEKLDFIEGQVFDPTSMVVTASYNDGSRKTVTEYTVAPMGALSLGMDKVTISYAGQMADLAIYVTAKVVTGIEITTAPEKLNYIEGQVFDPTSMVVTASYNDGSRKTVTEYTVAPMGALSLGMDKVTISYAGQMADLAIIVIEKSLTGITIVSPPIKTNYSIGDIMDLTGLVISGSYNDGSNALVDISKANISGFDSSRAMVGQIVSVSVNGNIATFSINVIGTYVSAIKVSGMNSIKTVAVNSTVQMLASISPAKATLKTVSWNVVSGSGDATIDSYGLVTGKIAGTVTVFATANDGSGVQGSCVVQVTEIASGIPISSISVVSENSMTTVKLRDTLQLRAIVSPANASNQSISWSVKNNTGSAKINANGLLTAMKIGNVTVTATANDGSGVKATMEIFIIK